MEARGLKYILSISNCRTFTERCVVSAKLSNLRIRLTLSGDRQSITLLATVSAVAIALLEAESIREIATADKAMIAELLMVVEGKAKMVERTGKYAVEYEMKRTTYEVK